MLTRVQRFKTNGKIARSKPAGYNSGAALLALWTVKRELLCLECMHGRVDQGIITHVRLLHTPWMLHLNHGNQSNPRPIKLATWSDALLSDTESEQ